MKVEDLSLTSPRLEILWRALESGTDMTAFQSWDWAEIVRSHVGREGLARARSSFRCLVVTDGSEPILLAPLRIQRVTWSPALRRGAYFLGHTTPSDYLDFIYRDFQPEALERVLAHLRDRYHVKTCTFDRILADSPSAATLASRHGARVAHHQAVSLEIPKARADYERLLSKRFRQNVRTAQNRAERDGLELAIEYNGTLGEADVDAIRRMRQARAGSRQSRTRSARALQWARRTILWGRQDGTAELLGLARAWNVLVRGPGGQLVAVAAGLVDHRKGRPTVRVNLVTYDERLSRYSPGIVGLHAFVVKSINEDGARVLDLTRGEERYKFDLGGRPHPYVSISVPLAKDR